MKAEMLEIQPQELKFIFEFKKQSSCSLRLTNNSDHLVAFKVKTTSSKKYCVRPNSGVVKPKLTCDLTVTMQAQNVAPPDFKCEDKFLIQSTIVPKGTEEKDITFIMFSKEDDLVQKKLKVILVSPPQSPVLSPMNEILNMVQYNAAAEPNDYLLKKKGTHAKVDGDIDVSRRESEIVEARRNEESIRRKNMEELRLAKDVEGMKLKLKELESMLREDKQNIRTRVQIGFPLLFVFVVALSALYLGYLSHHVIL